MTYEIGQIFDNTYSPEAAMWCNNNNAYIEEIESENGVRRFQIVAVPEESLEEALANAILQVDSLTSQAILAGFDYVMDGTTYHFSYDSFDQQNFADTANATILSQQVEGMPTTITWNAYKNYTPESKGELTRLTLDATAFLSLYTKGALTHKATQMEIGGQRKALLNEVASKEELQTLLQSWGI